MANPSTSEEYICTGESLADDTNTRDSSSNNGTVSTSNAFNYDEILENHLGQLGKFQLRSFLLLCLPAIFHGSTIMSYIFTGGVPLYRYLNKNNGSALLNISIVSLRVDCSLGSQK